MRLVAGQSDPDDDGLFRRDPRVARAHHGLPFTLLAVMDLLSRDKDARIALRGDVELIRLVDELSRAYRTLPFLQQVIRLLDDRELLLLDPVHHRGFLVRFSGVRDLMYHLYALVQAALLEHAGPGYLGAEPVNPLAVRFARNDRLKEIGHGDDDFSERQRFGFHHPGVTVDGGRPRLAPAIFCAGSSTFDELSTLDGVPVLFLTESSLQFSWDPSNLYPVIHEALRPDVTLTELPVTEVARLFARLLAISTD
ncbi:hypothetical protein GCM10027589_40410 [Actinocorallia lasiicapitis]